MRLSPVCGRDVSLVAGLNSQSLTTHKDSTTIKCGCFTHTQDVSQQILKSGTQGKTHKQYHHVCLCSWVKVFYNARKVLQHDIMSH